MATVTIIAGASGMGIWFANFLSANGYKVAICDKNESRARKMAKSRGFRFVRMVRTKRHFQT